MKRTVFLSLLIVFFIASCVFCAHAQEGYTAKIVELKGDVLIMKAAKKNWRVASVGTEFAKGDKIRTAARSYAVLIINNDYKNSLKLDPSTEITFESVIPGKLFLKNGGVLSRMNNLDEGSDFEVRTPTAVCGVLGTGWKTVYNAKNGKFSVQVFDNKVKIVFLDGTEREFEVAEGSGGIVANNDFKQEFLSQADQNEWDEFVAELAELADEAGQDIGGETGDKTQEQIDEELQDDNAPETETENPASPI